MKKISKREGIAIAFGLGVVAFLLFGGIFFGLFNRQPNQDLTMTEESQIPVTGVEVEDIEVGTGETAASGDQLTVHYVGTLPSGKVFDSSVDRGTPFAFTLGEGRVIRGWEEGMVGMKVGGKRKLIIAPDYGYGSNGVGTIPPNSILIFEVELLDVEKAAQ
jgi:FKBP-type peptidyl-prolyl cis-trans isomerase